MGPLSLHRRRRPVPSQKAPALALRPPRAPPDAVVRFLCSPMADVRRPHRPPENRMLARRPSRARLRPLGAPIPRRAASGPGPRRNRALFFPPFFSRAARAFVRRGAFTREGDEPNPIS